MKEWLKKVSYWCDCNIPMIWGVLWMFTITVGSVGLAFAVLKWVFKLLGVIS